jgi:tRNA-splicing ligase RtcB
MMNLKDFQKISTYLWEISQDFRSDMRVPARVYATREMLEDALSEKSIDQLINTATLPGVVKHVLAMPDIHQGYGFPIGGVAAMRVEDGVISPGGVGYDINCGVRLITSEYSHQELKDKVAKLITQIQRDVPSGVGRGGRLDLSPQEMNEMLNKGVTWALNQGYASEDDLEMTEENGCYKIADADAVSDKAKQRGSDQLGTLGAGNHFVEIQEVVDIFDEHTAKIFGIFLGQVTIMIHTGSRGLGHQVCTDYVRLMNQKMSDYQITLPDRQLACAPFNSKEGQEYFKAMAAAANFAWVNRQLMTDLIRRSWIQVLGGGKHQLKLVYDVAHNIAKLEKYDGKKLVVHRKGATRAFEPFHPDLPQKYQDTGQPVLIPGSMGTYSYVLAGTHEAMENTFGSTCHGAGRRMSRTKAKKIVNYQHLRDQLEQYGVEVRAGSAKGLVEEAPEAYKDIDDVIEVVHRAKIARKIAKMKPIAIVKG